MIEFLTQPIPMAVTFFLVASVPLWALLWWYFHRDVAYKRRFELQQQVWAMEQQIWDEQLSDEERERRREAQARAAAVQREARRRLGLPDEDES